MALATLSNVTVDEAPVDKIDHFKKMLFGTVDETHSWTPEKILVQEGGKVLVTEKTNYQMIAPGTPGVDPRDVLYALYRAKNRLNKVGWSHGMAVQVDGSICLGTALGMFYGHPGIDHYYDQSDGARAAVGRVTLTVGGSIPHWNDGVATSIDHVQGVLDNVINATIDELARSV